MSAIDDYTKDELYTMLEKYNDDTTGFKRQILQAIKYKEIDEFKASGGKL